MNMGKLLRFIWRKLKNLGVLSFLFWFTIGMGIVCIILNDNIKPENLTERLIIGALLSALGGAALTRLGDAL